LKLNIKLIFIFFITWFNCSDALSQVYYGNLSSNIYNLNFNTEPPTYIINDSLLRINFFPGVINKSEDGFKITQNPNNSNDILNFENNTGSNFIKLDSSYFTNALKKFSFRINDSLLIVFIAEKLKPEFNPKITIQIPPYTTYQFNNENPSDYDIFAYYKINIDPQNQKITNYSKKKISASYGYQDFDVKFMDNQFHFFTCKLDSIKYLNLDLFGNVLKESSNKYLLQNYNPSINEFHTDLEYSPYSNKISVNYSIANKLNKQIVYTGISILSLDSQIKYINEYFKYLGNPIYNPWNTKHIKFSPNGQILYIVFFDGQEALTKLYQFNTNSLNPNPDTFFLTKYPIESFSSTPVMGANGKLYLGPKSDGYVSLIKYPNIFKEKCGFIDH